RGPRPPPPRLRPATGEPASVIRAWSSAVVMVSAVASAALSASASLERRGDLPGGGAVQDDVCERSGDFFDCSGQVDRRRGDGRGVRGGAAGRERVLVAGRANSVTHLLAGCNPAESAHGLSVATGEWA